MASANPVKQQAVELACRRLFPQRSVRVVPLAVPSGVADQPMSDDETRQGATERARGALELALSCDLAVGLEGGVEEIAGTLMAFAWSAVRWPGGTGQARSASFALPPEVARLVRSGVELGVADDQVFGRTDSKRQEGAVGLLTAGAIDRAQLYAPAVLLSMVPFVRRDLFAAAPG